MLLLCSTNFKVRFMSILGLTCYKNMFMSILTRFLVLHSRFYFQYKNSVYFFKRNNIFSECETCARSSCITFQMLSARSQIFAWYIFCIKGAEANLYTFRYWLFSESIQICFRTLYTNISPHTTLNHYTILQK